MPHRTLLLLAFLPCLVHLSGQYEDGIHRLYYTDTGGEKGFTTYIYNGRSIPYKAIWELADGTRWSENLHQFDSAGHLISRFRMFSDSMTSRQEFYYNEAGALERETFERSDGVRGQVDYLHEDGKMIAAICRGLNGWFFGKITYYHGNSGLKDSATLVMEGTRAGTIQYSYDSTGRLEEEIWAFTNGFTQLFTYEYIESGCTAYRSSNVFIPASCTAVVREEHYDYNGEGGGPSCYEYDGENRLLKKTFTRSDGLKTVTSYSYRENGLLEKSIRHYNDGKTGTFTYTYDGDSQLVKRDFLRSDGRKGTERYMYDDHGRLISGEWENYDGWLTGTLELVHDRYDRVVEGRFTGTGGTRAGISFSYDANGHLTLIHWLFQDGSTQTYTFRY